MANPSFRTSTTAQEAYSFSLLLILLLLRTTKLKKVKEYIVWPFGFYFLVYILMYDHPKRIAYSEAQPFGLIHRATFSSVQ